MSPIAFKTMLDVGRSLFATLFMAFVWPVVETSLVLAQGTTAITPTTGVGNLGTTVTPHGHTVQITGGTRSDHGSGTNLFHSFDEFSVGRGDTAQFLNTTPSLNTSNILSRVTGENPSSILGAIDTRSYPGANLFLMNPAGIVFGPSARLHVGGSVAFTTADYLRLANANGSNAGIFHADTTSTSLLTSASISTFGFLSPSPRAIDVQGSRLAVQPGQSIALVGGDITVQPGTVNGTAQPARLSASEGQIIMVSVASPGEILSETLNQASNINGQSFGALGTIQISNQAHIATSDAGGGAIRIRGGSLTVDDSIISANSTKAAKSGKSPRLDSSWLGIGIEVTKDAVIDNGALVETNVEPGAHHESGGVRIAADHITISGGPKALAFQKTHPEAEVPFGIKSNVGLGSIAAKSGDIWLNASSSIQIKEHGDIRTETASVGSAGHIILKALGNIDIDSSDVSSRVTKDSSGISGNISIDAHHGNTFLTKARVFTATDEGSTGTLGNILVNAHNLQLRDVSKIGGDSNSTQTQTPNGDTVIALSGQLSLAGGSFINAGTFKSANSADLIIKSPTVLITGKDSSTGDNSAFFTSTTSSGNGGHLHLFTDNLQLTDGGILFSSSFIGLGGKGEIPSGRGGNISVEGLKSSGPSITIDGPGSGIFTSAQGTGVAGDISLKAASVILQNGGTLSAETSGTSSSAKGGSITVTATDHVALNNGASITASSANPKDPNAGGKANAGNISLNAGQQLDLAGKSSITTEAKQASGGNIKIQAIDRVRLVDSEISTSVKGADGSGGNIFIDPKVVVLQGSKVTAEAVGGAGGQIKFVTPLFLADSASLVSAKSQLGPNGTVTIQSPTSNLSGTVGQLTAKTSPAQVLLQNRCIALASGEQSTFILAGRDALPSEPGGWLSSPVAMEHWTGEKPEDQVSRLMARSHGWNTQPPLVMAKDEPTVLSLRRLTPPGFSVRSFETGTTGCPS